MIENESFYTCIHHDLTKQRVENPLTLMCLSLFILEITVKPLLPIWHSLESDMSDSLKCVVLFYVIECNSGQVSTWKYID